MKQKFLPWFLLFCALGLSTTAAYYSVLGLSIIFAGVAIPVIVMGSFLEISKIAIATYLHNSWKKMYMLLKVYLTIALVTLSIITSIGIYGLLSTGFQENIAKMEIGGKQVQNIEVKKQRFEEIKTDLEKEKTTLDKDISQLRNALSTNTTTQSVDKKTDTTSVWYTMSYAAIPFQFETATAPGLIVSIQQDKNSFWELSEIIPGKLSPENFEVPHDYKHMSMTEFQEYLAALGELEIEVENLELD